MSSSELTARLQLANRQWRILFFLYAAALTLATHWPRLQLPPQTPASDKTIHVVTFGIATILLWQTRWIRSLWILGVIAMLWAAIDEATQAIPIIHRHASVQDFAANAVGVAIAMVIMIGWRLVRPVLSPSN